MRKKYNLRDLDCANCAAKMESAINKLDGVSSARVNFMTQKLTIEAEDALFPGILDSVEAIMHKVEPDCCLLRQ